MERRIYEAAVEGSVESLHNLLREDALVLDKFMVSCYSETPLHIASMLGHVDFVQEILNRKPELAGELDSRNSSPLHSATAKGYLVIVKKLVSVNPEMCFACDRDGRNPLHIAAIKGHVNVLRELVQVRPEASRILMERGETILHACVNYSKLEAMKLLVETMHDHEFVNSKDVNGNTILHLAVIDKQVEAIQFLTGSTTIEVNSLNVYGLTALDILTQSKRDVKDWEIGESLHRAGAISAKSTHELGRVAQITSTSVLRSDENNKGNKRARNGHKKQKEWLKEMRSSLMIVATLIAAAAFQAGVSPPGGTWQETSKGGVSPMSSPSEERKHYAGYSIIANEDPANYGVFYLFNSVGFVASLSILLLLISGLPFFRRRFFIWILMVIMWIAISSMAVAYLFSIVNLLSDDKTPVDQYAQIVICVWVSLMGILLLGHIVRLMVRMIKLLIKKLKKSHEPAAHDTV